MSVAAHRRYLAFFPVAIGALRGLQSPDRDPPRAHAHATAPAGGRTLLRLRLPAAVPYLLPALRLAAANAVIGAVVAEVSIGLQRRHRPHAHPATPGQASGDPAKAVGADLRRRSLLGLVAAGSVALLGVLLGTTDA